MGCCHCLSHRVILSVQKYMLLALTYIDHVLLHRSTAIAAPFVVHLPGFCFLEEGWFFLCGVVDIAKPLKLLMSKLVGEGSSSRSACGGARRLPTPDFDAAEAKKVRP